MNAVHHLRRRPGRDGAALARRRRAAPAPGRPERRLRRQAGQRGGGQGDPAPRSATRSRCSWAAASATSTPSSATSTTACSYVIIGTAAVKNPGFLKDACSAFGGHIIVGLDAKDGKVATDGWSKLTGHEVVDLAQEVRGLRRRRRDLHRHRPRRHAHRHQHRRHGQAGAGADDPGDRLGRAVRAWPTSRSCARSRTKASRA